MENFKWKVNNLNLNEIRKDKSRTKKEKLEITIKKINSYSQDLAWSLAVKENWKRGTEYW